MVYGAFLPELFTAILSGPPKTYHIDRQLISRLSRKIVCRSKISITLQFLSYSGINRQISQFDFCLLRSELLNLSIVACQCLLIAYFVPILIRLLTWTLTFWSQYCSLNEEIVDIRFSPLSGAASLVSHWIDTLFASPLPSRYRQTWCHPQNRKYTRYRIAAREGPNHGHKQHAQKIGWSLEVWLLRYSCGQTYRQTILRQTDVLITIIGSSARSEIIYIFIHHRKW